MIKRSREDSSSVRDGFGKHTATVMSLVLTFRDRMYAVTHPQYQLHNLV